MRVERMAVKKHASNCREIVQECVANDLASRHQQVTVAMRPIAVVVKDEDGWFYKINDAGNLLERWADTTPTYKYKTKEESIETLKGMKRECDEAIRIAKEEDTRIAEVARQSESIRRMERLSRWQALLDDSLLWEKSLAEPLDVQATDELVNFFDCECEDARCYLFQNSIYCVTGDYTEDQDKLLVQEAFDSERRKFEKLKRKFGGGNSANTKLSRQPIPEDVRIAVWRRDGGCCALCGSRERLEYDHIIPVSCGGSNTVRNIELLCETCNRSKGDQIQ